MEKVGRNFILLFFGLLISGCRGVENLPEPPPPVNTLVPTVVTTPLPPTFSSPSATTTPTAASVATLPPTDPLPPTASPTRRDTQERLIIWGISEWPDGACHIWILSPVDQQGAAEPIIGDQSCNYAVVEKNGKQFLASLPSPYPADTEDSGEVVLYDVKNDRELVVHERIPLGDVRLTNTPQWASDGSVYFSGILGEMEQIFRYDGQTGAIEQYLDVPDAFPTDPLLSPDDRHLAYLAVENHESSADCGGLTCTFFYYHVWDVQNGRDLELGPLIEPWIAGEPFFAHWDAEWSPSGKFLAFQVGADSQEPRSVAVINIENREATEVINADAPDYYVSKYEWLSDDRLALVGSATLASTGEHFEGYFLYHANDRIGEALADIPERNKYDFDIVSINDWTEDGAWAVGKTQVPGDRRTVDLVIVGLEDNNSIVEYVRTPDEFVDSPLWSESGNFLAYRSENADTSNRQSRFTIIDRAGRTLIDTGMRDVFSPYFAWLAQPLP